MSSDPSRADALLSLALADKTLDELVDRATQLAAVLLPGADVLVELGPDAAGQVPVVDVHGTQLGALRVTGEMPTGDDERFLHRLAEVVGVTAARLQLNAHLEVTARRMIEAQRISGVGSYDFEIATNTNTWSDQLYRIYGREPQSFMASYEVFLSMLHPDDREHVMAVHQRSLSTLEPFEMEERVVWPDGTVRTLASWGEVVADEKGQPARMVGICWDITERRAIEDQLVHDALHDKLTGLPNRALLVDRLSQSLSSVERRGTMLGVLFLDVDRFKVINDSLGHEAGDDVLVAVAERLLGATRPGDTVARFGGDEFVVLCESIEHPAEAMHLADRLQAVLAPPIDAHGADVVVSASIGIALSTTAKDTAGDLLRDADAAMYRAKRDGRAHTVLFADNMREEALTRLETEVELRRALLGDQLRLHYQPFVDIRTGKVTGAEALLRWEHPTRGLVLPHEVIGIAEETGLIVPIGEWVLETACRQLVDWPAGLTMAVNLSGVQITRPDFAARVADVLERTGVDRSRLSLEITESVLMHDADRALEVLTQLRDLGVRVSIDDFGTGYSSLSYLKRFPVDTLKIDRSFVSGLGEDPDDHAIVSAVIALARALALSTVAEGVETDDQLAVLRELGASHAQGYLLSRPVPPEELDLSGC